MWWAITFKRKKPGIRIFFYGFVSTSLTTSFLKLSCLSPGLAGLILSNTCIPDIKHWKVHYILKVAMLYFPISDCRITPYASNSNPKPSLWPPALTFLPSNKADNVSLIPAKQRKVREKDNLKLGISFTFSKCSVCVAALIYWVARLT